MSGPTLAPLFDWRQAVVHPASPLSHHAITTGLYISSYVHSSMYVAWPGQERLAAELRRSVRAIQRDINELRRCGYLRVQRRKGNTNVYHLSLPPIMAQLYVDAVRSGKVSEMPSVSPSQAREGDTGVLFADNSAPPESAHPVIPHLGDTTGEAGDHTTGEAAKTRSETREPPAGERRQRQRTIFGALQDFMGRPAGGGETGRWGRIAKLMAQDESGVTPEEVRRRGAAMKAKWPHLSHSPDSLWNNWGRFAEGEVVTESAHERRAREDAELHEEVERLKAEGVIPREPGQG